MFELQNTHHDIHPLTTFELEISPFTILTGTNGSGKSRLLAHIQSGKIALRSRGAVIPKADIILTPISASFSPLEGGDLQRYELDVLCRRNGINPNEFHKQFNAYIQRKAGSTQFGQLTESQRVQIDKSILEDLKNWADLDEEEKATPTSPTWHLGFYVQLHNIIRQLRQKGEDFPIEDIPYLVIGHRIEGEKKRFGVSIESPLSLKMLALFEEWRQAYARNDHEGYQQSRGRENTFLSEEQFRQQFGEAPWEILNRYLAEIGSKVRFLVNDQKLYRENTPFTELELQDLNGEPFPPSGLSSGERVIMLLALSDLLDRSVDHISFRKPKFILFDEPDAHLHPSLCSKLLDMLRRQFVDRGIGVVLTTHSATTVALANEGEVITLEPHRPPAKSPRRKAVNILLEGSEKLHIDLSGSKVVFVEDITDEKRFNALTSAIGYRHNNTRLIFSSLARRAQTGTKDGGKATVQKVLSILSTDRNVVGLIDHDDGDPCVEGVVTLCLGERYSIENLLLDPRILLFTLLRAHTRHFAKLFDFQISRSSDFFDLPDEDVQHAIFRIHKFLEISNERTRLIKYEDGKIFQVGNEWLDMNGHELESCISLKLRLQKKCHGAADPLSWIAEQIIGDAQGILPYSFRETLQRL